MKEEGTEEGAAAVARSVTNALSVLITAAGATTDDNRGRRSHKSGINYSRLSKRHFVLSLTHSLRPEQGLRRSIAGNAQMLKCQDILP